MHIALVSTEYPPETAHGGIGSQTYLKAHGLARLGHDVAVISLSRDESRRDDPDGDVRVIRVPSGDSRLLKSRVLVGWLMRSTAAAVEVARLHEEKPLDLVDFPDWGCEAYVHLLNRDEWNYIPTVVHLHGPLVMFGQALGWPEPGSELYRTGTAMEETCLRLADAVFSSSDCSADWCARSYGLDRARIPTLHTGVDTQLFSPQPVPKNARPTVVYVGNIAEEKGVGQLVEAVCELAAEYPRLLLRLHGRVRHPVFARHLKDIAASHGLPDLLRGPRFLPREELPAILSASHVFAAPSLYEGGPGFVYLEAMACGLPVVGCEGSGASEVIESGKTGLLVPPGDRSALIEALRRLLSDPGERDEMGKRAREYVVARADTNDCIRRLEAFYASVVERSRGSPVVMA